MLHHTGGGQVQDKLVNGIQQSDPLCLGSTDRMSGYQGLAIIDCRKCENRFTHVLMFAK